MYYYINQKSALDFALTGLFAEIELSTTAICLSFMKVVWSLLTIYSSIFSSFLTFSNTPLVS